MRIGIDFDNTIACYDGVFHAAGVERGLIPAEGVAHDKTSVRDYLRGLDRDPDFTELQGYVYGPGMKHVGFYPGLLEALAGFRGAGHELFIVSHKTKTPFAGPAYDLHGHAREFLVSRGLIGAADGLFAEDQVFFEVTKEDKAARAVALGCQVFIDDLPEILALEGFAPIARKILFDPDGHHRASALHPFETHGDWASISRSVLREAN